MFMKIRDKKDQSEEAKAQIRTKISFYVMNALVPKICKKYNHSTHVFLKFLSLSEEPEATEFRQKLEQSIEDIIEHKIPSQLDYQLHP